MPIVGFRYTKTGKNYDLCSKCFEKQPAEEKAKFEAIEKPKGSLLQKAHWGVVAAIFALMVATKPRDIPGVPGDVPGAPVCSPATFADCVDNLPHTDSHLTGDWPRFRNKRR